MLTERQSEVVLKNTPASDWILLNPDLKGFYRTAYSNDMIKMLLTEVEKMTLGSLDRLGLITNMFAMINARKVKVVDFLEVLKAYKSETDYNVWVAIHDSLRKLKYVLEYTDCYEKFQNVSFSAINPVY